MATPVSTWKSKSMVELPLPSGNVCLAKRSGIENIIKSGRVPNSLMPMMKAALTGGVAKEAEKIEMDEKTISDMFDMFDVAVTMVVVQPKVWPVPTNPEAERDEEKLYVDEVDTEDKQFIFQWAVGGTSNLEKFREGLAAHVANLQAGNAVRPEAEPTSLDQ